MVEGFVLGFFALAAIACISFTGSSGYFRVAISSALVLYLGALALLFAALTALLITDSASWSVLPFGEVDVFMQRIIVLNNVSASLAFIATAAVTSLVFFLLLSSKPSHVLRQAMLSLLIILGAGVLFITTDALPIVFVSFELLLLSSLYLLRLTSKSERVAEASVEMFFWTLVGSAALLVVMSWFFVKGKLSWSNLYTGQTLTLAELALVCVGFGVKIPVWPFFSWLLKAHVEASVEFSILLSGFIVKVGVFGVYRFLHMGGNQIMLLLFLSCCLIGLTFATIRLFAQRDLKRIVALTTVIEMNWVGVCLAWGGQVLEQTAVFLVVAHSITTALEFSLVECISKRYGTRDLTQVSGLAFACPLLCGAGFLTVLVTIGFPGTPLFLAKALFFSAVLPTSWSLAVFLGVILLLLTPLFFIRIWIPVFFGLPSSGAASSYDLTGSEMVLFGFLFLCALVVSFWPSLLLSF